MSTTRTVYWPLLLGALLVALPAQAQQDASPQQDDEDVVIIGVEELDEDSDDKDEENGDDGENDRQSRANDNARRLGGVEVIGRRPEQIDSVPGSREVISSEDLEAQRPLNSNEALQSVSGITVQDEEGMGLRQNIGMRGLNPNRSRKVLMLEDGVPISLGPYGEPEMYYTPPIDRMERIEVVKGSGAILFGPQTIGGVINYITPAPPEELTTTVEAQGGTYGFGSGRLTVGDTAGDLGYLVSAMHQRFTGPRQLNLNRTDVSARFDASPSARQNISLKLGVYDESSASTYLGLTTPQYEANPQANYAENDRFVLRRYAGSLTHSAVLTDSLLLETRIYAHNIARNWRRQDFHRADQGADYARIIDGQGDDITATSTRPDDGSAIYFLDSSGNRNREFNIAGVEPRLTVDWSAGPVSSELQTGLRFHYEHTKERRINGEHGTSSTGVIASDDERYGRALAAYALNRFALFDETLNISPGIRLESLWTEQQSLRDVVDDGQGDSTPTDLDPPRVLNDHHLAVLPGLGVAQRIGESFTVFAGAHRGWAPPRTKDAVTTDGDTLTLEAEDSWNYEVGLRARLAAIIRGELAGFVMDFQNQVVPPNEASGAVGDNIVNGGESLHAGIEASVAADPAAALGLGFSTPVVANYTYVHSEFGEGWSQALQGQTLPYAPEHQIYGRLGFAHQLGLRAHVDAHYLGAQFTDKVETEEPSRNGLQGSIDPRLVLNAQIEYGHKASGFSIYGVAKNLLDEQYIASRSPRGIQPGLPRHLMIGLRYQR